MTPAPTNASMTLYEPVSKDAVRWLLKHVDKYVEEEKRDQMKALLHKTLAAFQGDSKVLVEYHRKIEFGNSLSGRMYSSYVGFQMMFKKLRGALARHSMEVYGFKLSDIDMENSHPTLFAQLCQRHQVEREDNHIEKYNSNREGCLKMVCDDTGCDRGMAKALFQTVLNYQTLEGWMRSSGIEEWDEDSPSYVFCRGTRIVTAL